MTLQKKLEDAVASAVADTAKLKAIIHGPATGPDSTVTTDGGAVKTLARISTEAVGPPGRRGPRGPRGLNGDAAVFYGLKITNGRLRLDTGTGDYASGDYFWSDLKSKDLTFAINIDGHLTVTA